MILDNWSTQVGIARGCPDVIVRMKLSEESVLAVVKFGNDRHWYYLGEQVDNGLFGATAVTIVVNNRHGEIESTHGCTVCRYGCESDSSPALRVQWMMFYPGIPANHSFVFFADVQSGKLKWREPISQMDGWDVFAPEIKYPINAHHKSTTQVQNIDGQLYEFQPLYVEGCYNDGDSRCSVQPIQLLQLAEPTDVLRKLATYDEMVRKVRKLEAEVVQLTLLNQQAPEVGSANCFTREVSLLPLKKRKSRFNVFTSLNEVKIQSLLMERGITSSHKLLLSQLGKSDRVYVNCDNLSFVATRYHVTTGFVRHTELLVLYETGNCKELLRYCLDTPIVTNRLVIQDGLWYGYRKYVQQPVLELTLVDFNRTYKHLLT